MNMKNDSQSTIVYDGQGDIQLKRPPKRKAPDPIDIWLRRYAMPLAVILSFILVIAGLVFRVSSSVKTSAYLNPTPAYSDSTPSPKVTDTQSVYVVTPAPTQETQTTSPAQITYKATIVLDAGHGGFDPGTAGTITGIREDTVNLAITLKLQSLFENAGYKVIMTRTTDDATGNTKEEDMQARENVIKSAGVDCFICIHQNAFEPDKRVKGPEVYYYTDNEQGHTMAQYIQSAMDNLLDIARSRGCREYGHRLTKFIPYSVLIECGYMTNPDEEASLVSDAYQERVAEAIFSGFEQFYANEFAD